MERRLRWTVALGACLAGWACDPVPEVPPEARVAYDTVGGVEHVISGARGSWSAGDRWTVPLDSAVVIGRVDGPPEYTFGDVTGVAVGEDGRIYVGDTQALEVRVFSPDGAYLTRFGRDGEGPGEFRNISGVAPAPGGIAVLDGRLARVTVFTTHGEPVRSIRLERPYLIFDNGAPMVFDADGRYFDRTLIPDQAGPGDRIGVVTYGPDGGVADSVVAGSGAQDLMVIERDGRPIMAMVRPLTPRPEATLGPGGAIYFTEGATYRVVRMTSAGDTVRVIRRALRPRPVTARDRDSARALIADRYQRAVGTAPPAGIELPMTKPVIAGLHVDAAGNLWIQSYPDPSWHTLEWWVHDPAGRYLGVVVTPRMDVHQIGEDFVAGVVSDEMGVQRVVIIPIM